MSMTSSKTTQNVALASTPAAAVLTLLSVVRGIAPTALPWPAEVDAGVCSILGLVLLAVPIVSRKIALWRDPDKPARKSLLETVAETVLEVPPDVVAQAAQGARDVGRVLTAKNRPKRGTAEVERAKFVAFAERLKIEADKARAGRAAS